MAGVQITQERLSAAPRAICATVSFDADRPQGGFLQSAIPGSWHAESLQAQPPALRFEYDSADNPYLFIRS